MYSTRYSFVIATYGEGNYLRNLMESLVAQAFRDYEIIVVDQNKHERVKLLCNNYEKVKYIHSRNRGLSLSRNIGIGKASGEYIVFPDDDAVLPSNFLENANNIIQKHPDISLFSGIVLTIERKKPFSRYMDYVSEEISYRNYAKFMSSTMVIHYRVFDKLKGFDEEMGVGARWGGSEETELLLRALGAGFRAYYTETLIAYHPEANYCAMAWGQVFQKGFSYGLGRGALFRKLINNHKTNWVLWQWVLSLLRSLGGMGVAIVGRQWKDAFRHYGAFWGRIVGFIMAKPLVVDK